MQTQMAETPITGAPKVRTRSGRTPLQPKNSQANPIHHPPLKSKPDLIEISVMPDSNKENNPPKLEPLEASLAEELMAIKKKLERLRLDQEKTERMLKERETVLDGKMKELQLRGQIQKCLEIEVDRLFRLKELKYRCMRVSPIRSLREKEQGKIVNESTSEVRSEEMVESEEECEVQSPGSASSEVGTQTN